MKKLFLLLFVSVLMLPLCAQHKATVHSKHSGGATVHHDPVGLTVSTVLNIPFWVYIDDVLQNELSVRSISVTNIPDGDHFVLIMLDDDDSHCFGQYVVFDNRARSFVLKKQGSFYGWEVATHAIRPEVTVSWVFDDPMPMPVVAPYMSDRDFEEARMALSAESYDNTRLTMAKQIATTNPLGAYQVTEICKLFTFESNRLEFAKFAYPYCVDKNKYYLVNSAFSYDSSKREMDAFINGH